MLKRKAKSRRYIAETTTDADYADDLELHVNTPAQAESLLHCREQASDGISLHVNANKTEYTCFKRGAIFTSSGKTSSRNPTAISH